MKAKVWYKANGVRHVTGFLKPHQRELLKQLAEEADQSLSKYVTRLLESHLAGEPKSPPCLDCKNFSPIYRRPAK